MNRKFIIAALSVGIPNFYECNIKGASIEFYKLPELAEAKKCKVIPEENGDLVFIEKKKKSPYFIPRKLGKFTAKPMKYFKRYRKFHF